MSATDRIKAALREIEDRDLQTSQFKQTDIPRLIAALRRAETGLYMSGCCITLADIADILEGKAE